MDERLKLMTSSLASLRGLRVSERERGGLLLGRYWLRAREIVMGLAQLD